ncbi:MAG: hypothetical protein QOE38_929 [Thermoleophilaceae bacterium]|nr:hypothetical protein [Thermoleophilaceae bacterium]
MTAKELFLEAMRRTDAGNHEGFLALQADDAEWRVPGAEVNGKEELLGWMQPFWQGFSNYRHDFVRVVQNDSVVFAEGTWTGVNDGPLITPDGEAPSTGRTVSFRFAIAVTVDEVVGQATAVNLYFDQLEFLGQLGLVPEMA